MRNNIMFTASATLALATLALAAVADDWYPSKYGADDTLGATNNLSPEKVIQAAKLVKTGKTYPLGVVTGWETPAYPPRQYSITIIQPGQDLPFLGASKATGNDDLLVTWLGIGSQIDGLGQGGEIGIAGHAVNLFPARIYGIDIAWIAVFLEIFPDALGPSGPVGGADYGNG